MSRWRKTDDRGAAAVEFAMLFPVFMVLALGTVYGGLAYSKQLTVTQAAREASRYGATLDVLTLDDGNPTTNDGIEAWLRNVRDAARSASGDPMDPLGGYDYVCAAYVVTDAAGGVVAAETWRVINDGAPTNGSDCPSSEPPVLKGATYVHTTIARDSQLVFLFINPTVTIDSESVTPYEGRPF